MAPMPLTGTIGTTSSLKSENDSTTTPHRRSLPEPVVSFQLPTVRRIVAQNDKASKKGKQSTVREEQPVVEDDGEQEDQLSIESSLILLQSLRQSRLIHLTAMLPYLSTRHRTSTKYHSSPPGHPFPGGLDPSSTTHSLIHLGRADVRTGPLAFLKTRFGEVRVEGGIQDARGSSMLKAAGKSSEKKEDQPSPAKSNPAEGNPSQLADNDELLQAVIVAAQKDSKLQAQLQAAAGGKASQEELRELNKVISLIREGLPNKGKSATPEKAAAPTPVASGLSAAAASSTPARQAPSLQRELPSYPPIITVEFRENPSARFILPLWRGCAVERTSKGDERTIKVTMLLPAIGSTAALRAERSDPKVNGAEESLIEASSEKTSPMNPPTMEQLTAPAPKGAETHAVTWVLSGNSETPLPDGVWHIFGRVSGAKTTIDKDIDGSQANLTFVQQFVEKLQSSMMDLPFTPQLQVVADSVPRDLAEHLTDKFAPRMQSIISKPVVKLKRGEAEEEEVELVRDINKRGWSTTNSSSKASRQEEKRKRMSTGGSFEGGVEGEESLMSIDEPLRPKRKRHVAKFNADGSLKLCQACGTNSTPMWRRGPAGKSTLCNACGAKWKVGRLVVSGDVPMNGSVVVVPNKAKEGKEEEQPLSKESSVVAAAATTTTSEPTTTTTESIPAPSNQSNQTENGENKEM